MLTILIPARELFDEVNEEFVNVKETRLVMEHSLVSISKWESKWHKPFISKESKTNTEIMDYIRCMTITQNVDAKVYLCLTEENITTIREYIENPMSATTFREENQQRNSEIITSELIYYWMTAFQIPFECEKWHIARLLNLIKICNIKNQPPKKMSKNAIMSRNAALNAARRKKFNTKG